MEKWTHNAINYQVNLRAIASREPRNPIEAAREQRSDESTLSYLAGHIDVIAELGVTVLHIMPPFVMGVEARKGIGSPYAARDFLNIDPEYGTIDEFKTVVRNAHEADLKVIIGMVPNHTSRDHVWITEHPQYYVHDKKGEPFFDLDWSDTAKLDYHNPELRTAMLNVYDHWLSILGTSEDGTPDGVDGFRLDMAHFINDKTFWDETIVQLKERHKTRELLLLAECYGFKNNLDLFGRGINAAYDDEFYKCMEYYYGRGEDNCSRLLKPTYPARHNHDFRDKYEAFKKGGISAAFREVLLHSEQVDPEIHGTPLLARYTDNHDEGRGVYRFGDEAVRALNELTFFSPHCIPFLLAGQEFAAYNRPSIHERIRPCDKGHRTRAGRKVFYEDGVEIEGNVFARTFEERKGWYEFYRVLINLRKNNPAFTLGAYSLLDAGEVSRKRKRTVIAFEREHEGVRFHCATNLGHQPRKLKNIDLFDGSPVYGELSKNELAAFSSIVVRMD